MSGNLEQVRGALHGITGVDVRQRSKAVAESYFVIARVGRELDTVDSLRRRGVSAEWPSYEQLEAKRIRGGSTSVRRLRRIGVLSGYVFASPAFDLDFEELLREVVGAIGVARTDSGKPLFIAERDLAIIRRIAVGLNAPRPIKVTHDFRLGEGVYFKDDPMKNWPAGRVERLASDGRIGVEVPLMGRKVLITVLPYQIERRKHGPARDAASQPKALDGEKTRDTRLK